MKKEIQKLRDEFKIKPSLPKALRSLQVGELAGGLWAGAEDFPMVLKAYFQLFI